MTSFMQFAAKVCIISGINKKIANYFWNSRMIELQIVVSTMMWTPFYILDTLLLFRDSKIGGALISIYT